MSVYSKWFLVVLVISISGSRLQAADVVISNTGTIDYSSGQSYDVGQTFTATKTGRLTKIGVAVYSGGAAGTASLNVYAGDSSNGTLLYTRTGINFSGIDTVTDTDNYTFFEITIDSTVNLTSGQIYTFVLSPGEAFDVAFKGDLATGGTGSGYSGGMMYSDLNGGGLAEYDLVFSVTQSDPPATVPGAPSIGTATAGTAQATVTFTAPASDGGSPITGYTVTSSPGGITGTGASSPITVTGLTNGQAYTFSVTATNGVGTGSASAASNSATPKAAQSITFANPGAQTFGTAPTLTATSSSGLTVTFSSSTTGVCTITAGGSLTFVTAGTCTIDADQAGNAATNAAPTVTRSFSVHPIAPGAPTIGTATAGDVQASVTFSAPASNGGSPITGYTVTANPGGTTGTGAASPITVTGLTNGVAYTFTVTATNAAGTGAASAASNSVTPKAAQVITFSNPGAQNFGTTPTLTATSDSGLTPTFTSSTTGVCTITAGGALTFVTAGTCTINADQAGNGSYLPASQVTRSFTVNAVVPGAPTGATATASDTQASIAFTAPASTGGASITGYTVTANPGGATGTGAASPLTVTGLTNGVAYTFTVTATNSAGTGAASAASNSVTPAANQTITFANPGAQNFGTTPTLTATSDSGLTPTFTSSTTGVCTITAGGALTFVTAGTCTINADQAGNGSYLPASQVSRSFIVNPVVPGAPTGVTATPGDTQASIAFTAPASTGGASITGYTVTANPGGATGTGAASPLTVTGLTNGVAYTFTVTATNSAGTGAASAASNSVTPVANQTITFANPGAQNFGTTPTLTATSDSGLTPTFTSSTTGVCTITSGGALTFVTVGTCTINADQAGNASYLAAPQVSRSFTVNAVVPGAPAITSAAAGDRQATVAFAAPASNGGSSITGYTVTATPGGLTASGLVSPVVVTGLTNGTTYTFTVAATNGVGTGAASAASAPVTPAAPAPPSNNSPAPVNQCAVSFDPVAVIVPAAGELGTLDLLADSGCAWTVASPASWLRVEPTSGVGAATLSFVAQPNAAAVVREARVTAASASVVQLLVSQQGRGGIDGAPLELSALAAHRTVRLAWQLPAGAVVVDHIVEIGSAPGRSDLGTLRTNSAAAGFTAENVPVGSYYVRVRGVTALGASGASNEVILRIEDGVGGVPVPPVDLTPTSTGAARMGVRWAAPPAPDATSFIVEFGSAPGLSDLARVSVLDTRLEWDASIAPTTAFYVRVRAVNGFGESAPSNEIVMSRGAGAARLPGRPQALAATFDNQTLSVTWAPPGDGSVATGYILEIGSSPGASNLLQTTTTATSWAHSAPPDVVYYIRVRVLNAAGASAPSDEAVVNAGVDTARVPGAPENLVAQLRGGLLTLQWTSTTSGTAAVDYIVEAGSAPGLSDVGIISTGNGGTVWTFDGVPGGQTFFVRVRGRNAAGVGAASNEVRIGPGE